MNHWYNSANSAALELCVNISSKTNDNWRLKSEVTDPPETTAKWFFKDEREPEQLPHPGPVFLHVIWRLLLWRRFGVWRLLPAVANNTRIQCREEAPNEITGYFFQNNQGGGYMQSVMRTHLIQTSPSSRPARGASGEAEGEGEEEVEEEERWGPEPLF